MSEAKEPESNASERGADQTAPELGEFAAIMESFRDAMEGSRFEDVEGIAARAFQWVAENPPEESPADKLSSQASEAEQRADWAAAERYYREALELEGKEPVSARTHRKLGRLYRFLGQDDKAFECGRNAYELCRDHEVELLGVMAAVALARGSSRTEYSPVAKSALKSSLERLPTATMYAHSRADALVELAEQERRQGNCSAAKQLVDEAFELLDSQPELNDLPGRQGTISRAWEVRALTAGDQGDAEASALAWKNAVDWRDRSRCCFPDESAIDADEHSRFLLSAAEGLRIAGALECASEIQEQCRRIRSQWGLPAMPPAPKRRWFRFRLLTLFILLFIVGAAIGPLREARVALNRRSLRENAASHGVAFKASPPLWLTPIDMGAESTAVQVPPRLSVWRRLCGDETIAVIVLPSECWAPPALTEPELEEIRQAFPEAEIRLSL